MKSKSVASCTVFVPLERSVAFSNRVIRGRWCTLVPVAADGLTGVTFCQGDPVVSASVRDWLRPVPESEDLFATEWRWDCLYVSARAVEG